MTTEAPRQAGKLGKLPAKRDPRTLKLRDYLRALPPPPASRAWDKGIAAWGMLLNDQLGDCVCAAIGHAIQVTSANAASEVTLPDQAILTAYEQFCGYTPSNPNSDQGCVELDTLKAWQQQGIAGHKNSAYAACSLSQHDDVKDCINLFGFCFIGFNVPASAMQQFSAGQPWEVVQSDGGIIGGHAVIAVDYDDTGLTVITWGRLQRMSWAFWDRYVDEAYGVVTPEWIAANGVSPSNLRLADLLADVQQLQQQPSPPAPVVDPDQPIEDWVAAVGQYLVATRKQSITQHWLPLLVQGCTAWEGH